MILFSINQRIKNFIRVRILIIRDLVSSIFYDRKRNHYFDGQNGVLRRYYDSGTIKSEVNYRNGRLEGLSNTYYENGNICSRENYKDDRLNGLSKFYYMSGNIRSEIYYRNGVKIKEAAYRE